MSFLKSFRIISDAVSKHPLASKNKFGTYGRILKWQLLQLFSPGAKKVPFIGDTFLMVKKGMTGATGNIYFGLHEFDDMSFLLHFLRSEDCFVDVGANIGSYTVLASGVCKAQSVSFEPVPSTFSNLQENIRVNKMEALTELHQAAAGAKEGSITITDSLDTVNHILAAGENSTASVEVKMIPVDDLLKAYHNIRLIKIDAEGFETEVLNGMNEMLSGKELRGIIIELNGSGERYGFHDADIHEKLIGHGFEAYAYEPFKRKLKKIDGYNTTNTIYLRDLHFISERISSAEKIKIFSEAY